MSTRHVSTLPAELIQRTPERASSVELSPPRAKPLRSNLATARAARIASDVDRAITLAGVSSERVAGVVGVSRTIVDGWRSGERRIPLHEVEAMPACVGYAIVISLLDRIEARLPRTIEAKGEADE